jgi:hemoglobin-like flavoprotein
MTPEQKKLVKNTWKMAAPMADAVAHRFYERLFETDATARALFKSSDLPEQRRKLVQALSLVVQGIDDLATLTPAIADLGRRHAQLGVTEAQYESVGTTLLWTFEQVLGPAWTADAKMAWASAYSLLTDVMKEATVA